VSRVFLVFEFPDDRLRQPVLGEGNNGGQRGTMALDDEGFTLAHDLPRSLDQAWLPHILASGRPR